jgi:hypothetical protein
VALGLIRLGRQGQAPIIDRPHAPELAVQERGLLFCRIEAIAESRNRQSPSGG